MADETDVVRVQIQLNSQYRLFDASGHLPFSIVFALCRRSSEDTDPRNIDFQVSQTVLDVPYALLNGLLTLHHRPSPGSSSSDWEEADLSTLRNDTLKPSPPETILLPSRANQPGKKFDSFTEYRYQVKPREPLVALFAAGRKYKISLAGRDFGIHHWVESEQTQSSSASAEPKTQGSSQACRLISNSHGGFAVFKVVANLPWPPTIETHLDLSRVKAESITASARDERVFLKVIVTNTGSDPVAVQTRGQQRFLTAWGPFQPESQEFSDGAYRIIDPAPSKYNFRIVNDATGEVVRGQTADVTGCIGLRNANADTRPQVEDLITLVPGNPLLREIDATSLFGGLADGKYHIQLKSKGCWWHRGSVESEDGDDGRVPRHLVTVERPALVFEAEDVCFEIIGGKII